MSRTRAIGRTTIGFFAALILAAWFFLSNHCALAVLAPVTEAVTNSCPMHSAPVKKKAAPKTPCCKEIRAVVAKGVTANPTIARLIGFRDYASGIVPRPIQVAIEINGLDTGPPGCLSFAESVLQESLLAHAPPLS